MQAPTANSIRARLTPPTALQGAGIGDQGSGDRGSGGKECYRLGDDLYGLTEEEIKIVEGENRV